MKTQPIGLDYLLPVWVARVAQILGAAALLAVGYLIVNLLRTTPEKWPSALRLVILGGACFAVIQRARTVIPRLRDDRLQRRIKKFKALKKKSWDEMLDQLVADRDVELLDEFAAVMANPLTWGRKQRILTARDRDLVAEITESNGRVGGIRLELVVEE
jgi:hypothetical protein